MLPTKTDTEVNMKPYTLFTLNERKYLQESLESGGSIRKIAKALRRSPSTISREIKRNWSKKPNHYHHLAARIKYWERRKSCHRKNNLLKYNAAFAEALARASVKIKSLTLTLDNCSEFLGYKDIERDLNLKVYFADPHSPWQRSSNENVNDVFRFFFPRIFDFRTLSRERLDTVLDLINNRPRKCLSFISSIDFFDKTVALSIIFLGIKTRSILQV